MDALERLGPSPSLTNQAYPSIRKLLTGGTLAPGERLNEVEIAQALGISRGPVREALHLLEREGLVQRVAGRGAFVRDYSPGEARELAEARECLEVHAVRKICERAGELDFSGLESMLSRAEAAVEPTGSYPSSDDFHRAVLALAANRFVAELTEQLYARLAVMRTLSGSEPDRARQALTEHKRILAALRKGDEDAAVEETRQHISRGLERTLARVATTVADGAAE
jgi:DNA-binding GntR family transcriptional regulator